MVMPVATKVSPDSVPTLSTTSLESNLTEPIELFPTPRREGTEIELDVYGQTHLYDENNDLSIRSDVSVASARDIALLNRGGMGLQGISDPSFYYESSEGSESNVSPGRCQSAFDFTPTNLSTMFNIFDASHRKDRRNDDSHSVTNSVNDAATEVASNIDHSMVVWDRKIDSLEREITTLKEIIKADSVTILCLKTDLSALQEKEAKWIAKSRVDVGLSAEQKLSYESTIRQLEETIKLLSEPRDSTEVTGDGEQLKLENELFASQIIDNEAEIRETRKIMSQIAEENANLSMELADLKLHSNETIPLKMEVNSLAGKLADLESKLESGFFCKCSRSREELVANQSSALHQSDCIGNSLQLGKTGEREALENDFATDDGTVVTTASVLAQCDDVEVTLAGDIITSSGICEPVTNDCGSEQNKPRLLDDNRPIQERKPDAIEQQWGFCDCLRVVNKDNH